MTMRVKTGFLIIISLLLLVGVVTAHLPDTSTISPSKDWVIANGVDQASITVYALNATSGAHKGCIGTVLIDNPKYGRVSPLSDITDNSGQCKKHIQS